MPTRNVKAAHGYVFPHGLWKRNSEPTSSILTDRKACQIRLQGNRDIPAASHWSNSMTSLSTLSTSSAEKPPQKRMDSSCTPFYLARYRSHTRASGTSASQFRFRRQVSDTTSAPLRTLSIHICFYSCTSHLPRRVFACLGCRSC